MLKEKDILIRVNEEFKKKVQKKAEKIGLSVSSYIRTLLIKDFDNG